MLIFCFEINYWWIAFEFKYLDDEGENVHILHRSMDGEVYSETDKFFLNLTKVNHKEELPSFTRYLKNQ